MRRFITAALCGLLAASSAYADDKAPTAKQPQAPAEAAQSQGEMIDAPTQYHHCIALARQKPQEGWEEALAWTSLGGGEPARHCAAVALIGLGQFEEGATRLEILARDSHSANKLRAGMLAQAGQAWLIARQPEKAYADQSAALKLVPDAPDLLVDRAESLAAAKNYREALDDLNKAVEISPKRVDALVFRATAKRYLDDLDGAKTDLETAIQASPNSQEAWLESGMIKRLTGDDPGARKDWLKVLDINPNTPTADTARENIAKLDVEKVKQ